MATKPSDRAIAQALYELIETQGFLIGGTLNLVVERARELDAPAAPVVVGEDEPDKALLISMAMRCNHGFGLDSARSQESQIADMRRCWEEVTGRGFYKPERRDFYLNTLTAALAGDGFKPDGSPP